LLIPALKFYAFGHTIGGLQLGLELGEVAAAFGEFRTDLKQTLG
jgi:hypothetical protein